MRLSKEQIRILRLLAGGVSCHWDAFENHWCVWDIWEHYGETEVRVRLTTMEVLKRTGYIRLEKSPWTVPEIQEYVISDTGRQILTERQP